MLQVEIRRSTCNINKFESFCDNDYTNNNTITFTQVYVRFSNNWTITAIV